MRLIYRYALEFEVLGEGIIAALYRAWGIELSASGWTPKGYCTEALGAQRNRVVE